MAAIAADRRGSRSARIVSALARLAGDRSRRLGLALALAIAAPFALLLYFQLRLISDTGASSALALTQLSRQANDGIAAGIINALTAPRRDMNVLITASDLEPMNVPYLERRLSQILANDVHHMVTRFYLWSAYTDHDDGPVFAYDRETSRLTPAPADVSALLRRRLAEYGPVLNIAFEESFDGRPSYVQARLRYRDPRRRGLSSFIAFTSDEQDLKQKYLPDMVAALASSWHGPTGFPPLTVTLLNRAGEVIAPKGASAVHGYAHEHELPLVFFTQDLFRTMVLGGPYERLRLRTGYGDRTIAGIVEARQRPQRLMILVLAGMMAAGVFFVARRAAREIRLAELKSDFVLSISHDLKTPLALIELFAETLELNRVAPARRPEYYRVIHSETRHLARLIDNVIDFSRGEAGLRSYSMQSQDLETATRNALASFANQFEQRGFTVISEFAPNLPLVHIDKQAVMQAVENLLSNAIKYSSEDRRIWVSVNAHPGYVAVTVKDAGVGISKRFHRKIFQKFYRVSDSGAVHGCGLGLAIVEHVMEAHHGFVHVESAPGEGSTFSLYFPVAAKETQDAESDSAYRGRAADATRTA